MFAKLLKHEFKSVSQPLTIASIAALLAGALGGFLFWAIYDGTLMENHEVLFTVMVILFGGVIIALVAYGIGTEILLLYRFYKSKFSDEGYLTFTTPASTHQILLSSILNIFLWMLICIVVLFIAFCFILIPILIKVPWDPEVFNEVRESFRMLGYETNFAILYIVSMIGNIAYSLVLPLLSITIGALVAKKHKLLCAFGVGYGINMAVGTLSSVLASSIYILALSGSADLDFMLNMYWMYPVLMLTIGIVGYFVMHYLIDKKLNI